MLRSFNLLYADDVKMARVIQSVDDCVALQQDLVSLDEWCRRNQLAVNAQKCSTLTVSNKVRNDVDFDYSLPGSEPLSRQQEVKDLGIRFDGSMKFDSHVRTQVRKAFKMLGFVMRTSRSFMKKESILHLYRTLVLPQLEYASVVWSPHYDTCADLLENVQRRFTRFMFRRFRLTYCPYFERLQVLGLLTLRKRRMLQDQMTLFSVVKGQMTVNSSLAGIGIRVVRPTRNCDLFAERTWRLRSSYFSPFPRMMRQYNKYFSSLDMFAENKPAYRSLLLEVLRQLPDSPD